MISIKDILDSISDEEKELHKDLIEECLKREKGLIKISENTEKNVTSLVKSTSDLCKGLNKIEKAVKEIEENNSDRTLLKLLPKEKCFKA